MRDSDRYKLAWKFQVDDLPPLGSLQPATWPLTDGLLGAPMQATSLLVKGTRDPLFPNLKKRKRANDAAIEATDNSTTSTTHGDKRAKYYCATCPPALAKTPRQFQGSWGNGEDIAPLDHTSKAYTNVNKANWRRAAFKHTCQGECLDMQLALEVSRPRVSVRDIATDIETVIETTWEESDIMRQRHLQAVLTRAGPVVQAIEAVANNVNGCMQ